MLPGIRSTLCRTQRLQRLSRRGFNVVYVFYNNRVYFVSKIKHDEIVEQVEVGFGNARDLLHQRNLVTFNGVGRTASAYYRVNNVDYPIALSRSSVMA